MKKLFLSFTLLLAVCTIAAAHNPEKKGNPGNPGNDSVQQKDSKTIKTPPAAKPKVKVPVKKSDTYEMKAPSIFTFTVLSTYLNRPLEKK